MATTTILMSRGNKAERLRLRPMQDGELFLEDKVVYENTDEARKNSRIHIWAQMGSPFNPNNPGAIDITDWIVRLIETHANVWKATGHTPTSTNEIPNLDQQELNTTEPNDNKMRPHGATATPHADRIAAYDELGRLSSAEPVSEAHVVRKDTLDNAVTTLTDNVGVEIANLKKWITWLIGETDANGNYIPLDQRDPDSAASIAFDQIAEIIQALNNDPNAFATLMNAISTTEEELRGALGNLDEALRQVIDYESNRVDDNLETHQIAEVIDHPDSSVTTSKIRDVNITTEKIANSNITTVKLADSAVTTDKINNQAVTTEKIDNLAVTTDKINDLAVTTGKIDDLAVTTDKINDQAITEEKIADSAITTDKLEDLAVTTEKINDLALIEAKLADSAVTTDKIDDQAVITDKIKDLAVTEEKIADNAVTTDKINDQAVTTDKLDDNAVTTEKLADNAVTTGKLADNVVTTAKITDKNITLVKVQDITADTTSTKATFSATAITFQVFLQTVWRGITWLTAKLHATSGHKHTGGTDDAPQIEVGGLANNAVETTKIKDANVTTVKIADKNVTYAKVQDVTPDTTSTKPSFTATAMTFLAFLQTVWRGITWLTANKQPKIVTVTCDTAAADAAKVLTIADYTLTASDILAVTYTNGNTANSATINVNNTGAKQVRLGGGQPTGASGTGSHYIAAGNTVLYYYDGTYMCQFGSTDITDANDTSITNVYGAVANQYKAKATASAGAYYPLIGLCEDGTIDKVTATSNSTATGARTFTTNKLSLLNNIFYASATTTAWTAATVYTGALLSRISIGTTNWKYAIGQYYNKAGTLANNDVTTDLVQTPLYVGGTRDGNYFTPNEFSLTLRSTAKVYKLIGYFTAAGNFYLSDYQPVFFNESSTWLTFGGKRTINSNDNSTADVTDTGGNLLVPLKVTLPAVAATDIQNTSTSAQALRTVLNTFRNNIAKLFTLTSETIANTMRYVEYTTPGTSVFTVPSGVIKIRVTACGGGGGGGGGDSIGGGGSVCNGGGGGGGAEFVFQKIYTVTSNQDIQINIGAGGNGGNGQGGAGSNGASTVLAGVVTLTGGDAGTGGSTTSNIGGTGGTGRGSGINKGGNGGGGSIGGGGSGGGGGGGSIGGGGGGGSVGNGGGNGGNGGSPTAAAANGTTSGGGNGGEINSISFNSGSGFLVNTGNGKSNNGIGIGGNGSIGAGGGGGGVENFVGKNGGKGGDGYVLIEW